MNKVPSFAEIVDNFRLIHRIKEMPVIVSSAEEAKVECERLYFVQYGRKVQVNVSVEKPICKSLPKPHSFRPTFVDFSNMFSATKSNIGQISFNR